MSYTASISCDTENYFKFDNYDILKARLDWFMDKGYKIGLGEIEKIVNEELLPEIKDLLGKAKALRSIEIPLDELIKVTISGYENRISGQPNAQVNVTLSGRSYYFKE